MPASNNKYNRTLPKLYQYPNWEVPASNIIQTHSLLSLSGYKETLKQNQSTIPHLVGLSRPEANYILLNETFYGLLIKEHYRLNESYLLENVQNEDETLDIDEEEAFRLELKRTLNELDREPCERRIVELKNDSTKLFPALNQLKHGDIIQFRNERLQFSFFVYQAKKGTFEQLLNQFQLYIRKFLEENDDSIHNVQSLSTNEYEFILIPTIEPDGYGIPSVFNDAPLYYFKHLSPGVMYRWIYVNLIDQSMPIYDYIQRDIQLKKQCPTYRTLVNEAGITDSLIDEEDGEEMTIEDLETFPNDYVCLYDEVKSKLNIEWRNIDANDYCNRYSAMYLLTKWTQQLQ
ncbi:hypothetical protein I4U23_015483 [Adineta vaga]|nr:hypothetical protein I4U23_015483 [Adineta vaga]